MKKFLSKISHNSLFMFGSLALMFASVATNYCAFFFSYEPEMPASMLETEED